MRPLWRRIPQAIRLIGGAASDALAIVIFLFTDAPALASIPTVLLAALFTGVGTLALATVILDKDDELHVLRDRLDERAKRKAGLVALDVRMEEGNELARQLRRLRSTPPEGMESISPNFQRRFGMI